MKLWRLPQIECSILKYIMSPFGPAILLHRVKDVVDEMKLSIHLSVPSSDPSSIHGWHHIIILYNVKAEKLL
jgi:hypothetical protein